ncbi:unnamed protein product [Symbiodinium necroappetens]|uniref:Uncharacterized protein n=1 Tax=Symbiodinium necroappetens TaxID=1628268 RepID=A0A813AUQ5_9DINO|nr:unnamed protein product [Symbiodinium necroappetens]
MPSDKMKEGYLQELEEGKQVVENARTGLEKWYARKLEDSDIVGEERGIYEEVMRAVEHSFTILSGKLKAVKTATAVNKEFQGRGMELSGAAGELIATSGKWTSNIQRDMLRRCKASKVPVTTLNVPVILKGVVKKRALPLALPHEVLPWLVQRGIFPVDDSAEIVRFWTHARSTGMATGGATDFHIPLWIWGDDAKFTETHQDKLVVVAFGRLLETSKNALKTVWPLFTYQQANVWGDGSDEKQLKAAFDEFDSWAKANRIPWHLASWFNTTERATRYLSVEEDSSLDAYLQLAKCAVEKKVCLFPIKPKFHGWQEMAYWAVKHRINPRTYHCFKQEDMVGSMVRIAESCHKRSVEETALARVYLQLVYSHSSP